MTAKDDFEVVVTLDGQAAVDTWRILNVKMFAASYDQGTNKLFVCPEFLGRSQPSLRATIDALERLGTAQNMEIRGASSRNIQSFA